jgi:hypothetical protein
MTTAREIMSGSAECVRFGDLVEAISTAPADD